MDQHNSNQYHTSCVTSVIQFQHPSWLYCWELCLPNFWPVDMTELECDLACNESSNVSTHPYWSIAKTVWILSRVAAYLPPQSLSPQVWTQGTMAFWILHLFWVLQWIPSWLCLLTLTLYCQLCFHCIPLQKVHFLGLLICQQCLWGRETNNKNTVSAFLCKVVVDWSFSNVQSMCGLRKREWKWSWIEWARKVGQ